MASLLPSQQNLDVQQDRQVGTQSLERVYYILHLGEGMGAEEKRKKTKIIPDTQPKAQAGWPKRLRLVQATP